MNMRAPFSVTVVALISLAGFSLHAQTTSSTPPASLGALPAPSPQSQNTTQAFVLEEQTLMNEWATLVEKGATAAQLRAWEQQNASAFALQRQRAQVMAAASALQLCPTNLQANIPADASPTLKDFLTRQANLANMRAQIHNQLVQAMSSGASAAQVNVMLKEASVSFEKLHAADMALEIAEGQTLTDNLAATTLPLPRAPQVAPNETSQEAAFRTQFYQLNLQRVELLNQYVSATPAVRAAALRAWRKRNGAQIQKLQQMAQALAQTTSATTN